MILCLVITGCKEKVTIEEFGEMDSIIYNGLLTKDGRYLVFIYGNTCSACEELEPTIAEYATLAKNNSKKYTPLYVLNSSNTRVNKGIIAIEGDSSYDDFLGTTDYTKIKIMTTPALIVVENHKVVKYISTKLTTRPKTEIKEYFLGLMK